MSLSLIAPMYYRNRAIKSVLDNKRNAETFLQRELLLRFILKNQFLCAILKLNFQGNDQNLKIKSIKLKRFNVK